MDCASVREQLEAYIDGDLDDALATTLTGHLRRCGGCAEEHRAAIALPAHLAALRGPVGPDLVASVMSRVRAGRLAGQVSAALLTLEAILACLALVQLGVDGLFAAAAASLQDGASLFGGSAAGPAPGDLALVLTLLALVTVTAIHLGLVGATTSRRDTA